MLDLLPYLVIGATIVKLAVIAGAVAILRARDRARRRQRHDRMGGAA